MSKFKEHQEIQTNKIIMIDGSYIPSKSTGTIIHIYDVSPVVYRVEMPLYKSSPLIVDIKENDIEEWDPDLDRPDINFFKP
jgi:hypothetical protein